jgi:hypothetical protein
MPYKYEQVLLCGFAASNKYFRHSHSLYAHADMRGLFSISNLEEKAAGTI